MSDLFGPPPPLPLSPSVRLVCCPLLSELPTKVPLVFQTLTQQQQTVTFTFVDMIGGSDSRGWRVQNRKKRNILLVYFMISTINFFSHPKYHQMSEFDGPPSPESGSHHK